MAIWVLLFLLWLPVLALILWDTGEGERIDPVGRFTAVLAVFTGVLCVIGYFQFQILKTTDETLWSNQRPWIGIRPNVRLMKAEVSVDDGVKSVSIDAEVTLNNYGNLPATNAKIARTEYLVPKSHDPANQGVPPSNYESAVASIEKLKRSRIDSCRLADDFENGEVRDNRRNSEGSVTDAPSIFPKETSDVKLSDPMPLWVTVPDGVVPCCGPHNRRLLPLQFRRE